MPEQSPELRIADADRDRAVDRLHAAASEGRLDPDELEERVTKALAARTQGELDQLTNDLPAPHVPVPRPDRSLGRSGLDGSCSERVLPSPCS
jgi:hypothetical protein